MSSGDGGSRSNIKFAMEPELFGFSEIVQRRHKKNPAISYRVFSHSIYFEDALLYEGRSMNLDQKLATIGAVPQLKW